MQVKKIQNWLDMTKQTSSKLGREYIKVVYCHRASVQFSRSVVSDALRLHELRHISPPLSFTISWSLLKFMSIKSVMRSTHFIQCCPLLLLPSIFPSIRVFSNESALHRRWPKYWSFSFSISPSNEYSELISFRIDWLDLLVRYKIVFIFIGK